MHERSKQTPLTEFLRYGAAGASGTVTEPYLILQKFPFPFIQVHYARGCTLAEAFYQSVHGPYQLLIVGDPLCRPWARIPKVTASGVEPNQVVSGDVRLEPAADLDVARFELFVDGIRRSSCRPGGVLKLDTRGLVDGFHELRIVAIEDSAIESQGRLIVPIQTANFGQAMRPRIVVDANSPDDRHVTIRVSAEGANRIQVYQMSQRLGSFTGSAGSLELKKSELGFGPISLRAVALSGTSAGDVVLSNPHEIAVAEPAPMPALGGRDFGRMRAGLRLATNGASTSVTDTSRPELVAGGGCRGRPDLRDRSLLPGFAAGRISIPTSRVGFDRAVRRWAGHARPRVGSKSRHELCPDCPGTWRSPRPRSKEPPRAALGSMFGLAGLEPGRSMASASGMLACSAPT